MKRNELKEAMNEFYHMYDNETSYEIINLNFKAKCVRADNEDYMCEHYEDIFSLIEDVIEDDANKIEIVFEDRTTKNDVVLTTIRKFMDTYIYDVDEKIDVLFNNITEMRLQKIKEIERIVNILDESIDEDETLLMNVEVYNDLNNENEDCAICCNNMKEIRNEINNFFRERVYRYCQVNICVVDETDCYNYEKHIMI